MGEQELLVLVEVRVAPLPAQLVVALLDGGDRFFYRLVGKAHEAARPLDGVRLVDDVRLALALHAVAAPAAVRVAQRHVVDVFLEFQDVVLRAGVGSAQVDAALLHDVEPFAVGDGADGTERGCLRPFGQASVVAASFMKRLPSLLSQR